MSHSLTSRHFETKRGGEQTLYPNEHTTNQEQDTLT
jgi:hypothetical protein